VYLDASYYVAPERAGEKPYTLLYEALRRSGQADHVSAANNATP
jgi:non-homologous end joining protein Ku